MPVEPLAPADNPEAPSLGRNVHPGIADNNRRGVQATPDAVKKGGYSIDAFGFKPKPAAVEEPPKPEPRRGSICGHKLRFSKDGEDARDKRLRDDDADGMYCSPDCAIKDAVALRKAMSAKES